MTCQTCGREAQNGTPTHWLGCGAVVLTRGPKPDLVITDDPPAGICEHDGCSEPKKEWSGKGAKPKYCAAGHKKEK